MIDIQRTILIPASQVVLARALAAALAPAGVGMFTTPVKTNGAITHYISSGWIDARFGAVLADSNLLYAACQATVPPSSVTLAQCQTLVTNSIVSDGTHQVPATAPQTGMVTQSEDAYALLARLGMTL